MIKAIQRLSWEELIFMDDVGSLIYDQDKKKKGTKKNQDGESLIGGILIGTVCSNYNPLAPDKVEVEIPIGGSGKTTKVWTKFMMPAGGKSWGMYWKPEVGDKVVISFINGNVNRPFVLGCAYPSSSKMISTYNNMLNGNKAFKTKSGSELKIKTEVTGDEISIKTAKGDKVVLNDTKDNIEIVTSGGSKLVINGKTGSITISADNKIELKSGSSSMTLKGTGDIEIKCNNLSLKGNAKVTMQGSKTEVKGTQVKMQADAALEMKGAASAKLESNTKVEVKGMMVQIN